nr:unnamed protein product [Digitaria exilis]
MEHCCTLGPVPLAGLEHFFELIYQRPSFVALQETKLNNLNRSSLRSFLPARLTGYAELPAQGASGGILSAWDDSVWNVRSQCVRRYTLTTNFTLYRDGTSFSVTNVYAPTNHADKPLFLHELASIAATIQEQCRTPPLHQREHDTKLLINALDLLEEECPLSIPEKTLRRLAIQGLQSMQSEKLAFWRQRFNIRMAVEWDENSKFFHATTLPVWNVTASDTTLMTPSIPTHWGFDLRELYPELAVAGLELSRPFTSDEITSALLAMDMHSSPGPDGFGPSFYKTFWVTLKPCVLKLFAAFHDGSLDLDALNRAHLVLLPKHDGANDPSNFRSISLQNFPMKLFSKALANSLKAAIPIIIDPDQTGFVHGRNIAENFVYAADLLTCRGFDERWRGWIMEIRVTGKIAVMLNGVPGNWITCKRGLRQGDPISPYLFLIVADVLQRLIQQAAALGLLQHPVDPSLPCPTLKRVLDDFSQATGLVINFQEAANMANILGCNIESFPQKYLGLPLSPHKLRHAGKLDFLAPTVIEVLDARRRSFLWTGEEKCHGSCCLVKWEDMCYEKEVGGLGIKNLEQQNHCLIMKLVHRLYEPTSWPWKRWFFSRNDQTLDSHDDNSFIANLIHVELERYRSITHIRRLTLCAQLRPRLSRSAAEEKILLEDCLSHVSLTAQPDCRILNHSSGTEFRTSDVYKALQTTLQPDPDAARLWKTKLPKKIQFFGWLLHLFDHKSSSAEDVIRRVVNDLDTWHCRYGKLKDHLKAWRDHLHSCL